MERPLLDRNPQLPQSSPERFPKVVEPGDGGKSPDAAHPRVFRLWEKNQFSQGLYVGRSLGRGFRGQIAKSLGEANLDISEEMQSQMYARLTLPAASPEIRLKTLFLSQFLLNAERDPLISSQKAALPERDALSP